MNFNKGFVALFGILVFVSLTYAAPRKYTDVTKTSRNDGDTITAVSVRCSSTAWTTLLSASTTRRVAKLNTIASTGTVILQAIGTSAYTLGVSSAAGYWMSQGESYEHASEAGVVCRSTDNADAVYVHGLDYTDSKDTTSAP